MKRPLFPLGQVVSTPGALEEMARANTNGMMLLLRHVTGDWGSVSQTH